MSENFVKNCSSSSFLSKVLSNSINCNRSYQFLIYPCESSLLSASDNRSFLLFVRQSIWSLPFPFLVDHYTLFHIWQKRLHADQELAAKLILFILFDFLRFDRKLLIRKLLKHQFNLIFTFHKSEYYYLSSDSHVLQSSLKFRMFQKHF